VVSRYLSSTFCLPKPLLFTFHARALAEAFFERDARAYIGWTVMLEIGCGKCNSKIADTYCLRQLKPKIHLRLALTCLTRDQSISEAVWGNLTCQALETPRNSEA
jgi:hypothetical protein